MRSKPKKTAISLFSGAGGFDIGIKNAGFDVLASLEIDKHCCATLRHNIQKTCEPTVVLEEDIRKVKAASLMKSLEMKRGDLDLLFGGPPCQSFSAIGKQKGIDDSRGQLIYEMVRFTRAFKPKFVVMEQVTGFANFTSIEGVKGGIKDHLISEYQKLGYKVSNAILNAADYGVPQKRKRFFLVAHKKTYEFNFPPPTHQESSDLFVNNSYKSTGEVLGDLGSPLPKGTLSNFSHVDVTPAGDINKISYVKEGESLVKSDAPMEIKGRLTKKDTTKFLRLSRTKQSNTLRCGEIFYHPTEDRYLTPREYMRIHSFPDDYELCGPIRGRTGRVKFLDQHRQVANSVPPRLAKCIGEEIEKLLQ